MDFCHISPVPHLEQFTKGRPWHLTLAHLVESNPEYVKFYQREKLNGAKIIMDNSAFEVVKHNVNGGQFYSVDQLINLAAVIQADYVVMTDYPACDHMKTVNVAIEQAPKLANSGFGTFYVPQSQVGDVNGLIESFLWALTNPEIKYIAFSILSVPNAYGVEKGNNLQRYLSRYHFIGALDKACIELLGMPLQRVKEQAGKRFHFLGMVDGPNEIDLIRTADTVVPVVIDTWDSSSAIWHGLNGISYDNSPTGLKQGKFEKEVDFNFYTPYNAPIVKKNMSYIDDLCSKYGI